MQKKWDHQSWATKFIGEKNQRISFCKWTLYPEDNHCKHTKKIFGAIVSYRKAYLAHEIILNEVCKDFDEH